MAKAGNEHRSFGVFWDIENCRVPKGGSARELVSRIRRRLYSTESDREAEFMCVCDASKENKELMKELNSAQVTIVHVDATNKNAADEKLRQRMRYFVETHKPPATVVLISGDVNFEGLLSDIQHRNQLDTILIHPDRINEGLRQCVQQRFPYSEFTNKLPNRLTTSKSTEHDCVILGLPCGRDNKALSARLHQLSENCGGKVLTVVPPRARIRFKDLELAQRAGGRMNGEDVFGTKIRVEIAPTPANSFIEHHNNVHQSPRSKSARKKLRKKRGTKSDYHSSDGSGNSPQSSPQGSPKNSPYRHRSPGPVHPSQQFSTETHLLHCASPKKVNLPSKPPSDLLDTEITHSGQLISQSPIPLLSTSTRGCSNSTLEICNGKFSPASLCQQSSSSLQDDGDSEMETFPWNDKGRPNIPLSQPYERERHHSYTPTSVYKKHHVPRNRTLSDPPLSLARQRTPDRSLNDSPSRIYYSHSRFPSQPGSPFRDPRSGFRGSGPGRRFSRSRSNSSNRSNQSSPSLSDSGDRFSAETTTSDPSFRGGSPVFIGQGHNETRPESPPCHRYNPPTDFLLRVTNLDGKKDDKELKDELKKYFQRHAKVEEISIEHQADGSVIGIVKVSTLKAAERAAAKLHRTTKIGCKRIHVYLKHQSVVNTKLKTNVIELLKEVPGHSLKWFKFVDLYEKRYHGRITLSEVEQLAGEVTVENDEQSGHSVHLACPITQPQANTKSNQNGTPKRNQDGTPKPRKWNSGKATPTTAATPPPVTAPLSLIPTAAASLTTTMTVMAGPPGQLEKSGISKSDQQVESSELCSLHHHKTSPQNAEASATDSLLHVHVHRKTFAAQVHTLLLGHNGSMPLSSFMSCYLSEFPPLPPGEVPLDLLISAIPGVCISSPESPSRTVQWAANQSQGGIPYLPPELAQLAVEVTEVLACEPRCSLRLSEFLSKYEAVHGKPCCIEDYGHTNLQGLMTALKQVVQVFGWGDFQQLSLTHQVQRRQFVSDLATVLREQPQWQVSTDQLPNAFCNAFRKPFNISNYGACYIEDLIADLPGNIILVSNKDGVQMLSLTRHEVLLELERRVVTTLRGAQEQGLALPVFLSAYHAQHGVNLTLADYCVTSVRELLQLLPASVTIERKSGRDVIRLLEDCDVHLQSSCACQVLTAYPDRVVACADFIHRFQMLYGQHLETKELNSVLQGVAEVTYDESGPQAVYILNAESLAGKVHSAFDCENRTLAFGLQNSDQAESSMTGVENILGRNPDLAFLQELNDKTMVMNSKISDICGNVEAIKATFKPELENVPYHLQSKVHTPNPKVNNLQKLNNESKAQLNRGNEPISASLSLSFSDVAMNNHKPDTLIQPKFSPGADDDAKSERSFVESGAVPPKSLAMVHQHQVRLSTNISPSFSTANPTLTAVGHAFPTSRGSADASFSPQCGFSPQSTDRFGRNSSRVASSRPSSRTASNSSGSPLGSPLSYPGTPRRNRLAAKFTHPVIPPSPPLHSDSDV